MDKFLLKSFNKKGQVIVEYILLLVVASVIALVLVKFASVTPSDSGPVFQYWQHLLEVVGQDIST